MEDMNLASLREDPARVVPIFRHKIGSREGFGFVVSIDNRGSSFAVSAASVDMIERTVVASCTLHDTTQPI